MKKLQHWFARRGALPLTCYLLALAAWLCLGLVYCIQDAADRAAGHLAEKTVAVQDWQLAGLEITENGAEQTVLTTLDGDPQMLLETAGDKVLTLTYTVQITGTPREMCLYYTTKPGQPYSADRRVYAKALGNGQYLYELPRIHIETLRLDPCSPDTGKTLTLTFTPGSITLNAAHTLPALWQYFVPSWYQAFCLVLYPGLAAAAVSWLLAVYRQFKAKKQ